MLHLDILTGVSVILYILYPLIMGLSHHNTQSVISYHIMSICHIMFILPTQTEL